MAKATPAVLALEKAGVAFTLHEYAYEAAAGQLGLRAAEAMGVAPSRVFKTLMALLDERALVVAVIPVALELDLKALAKAAGGKRAAMVAVAGAERATGYVKGGISPLGQKKRHPTLLDDSAREQSSIIVNGGRRGLQIELAPDDLLAVTGGRTAAIARA